MRTITFCIVIQTAYDFTGQFSSSVSEGIKVDTSPPQTTQSSIKIPSRHITSTRFIEAWLVVLRLCLVIK